MCSVIQRVWPQDLCFVLIKHPAAAAAKSLQSCPTLCDPMDSSPPGSPVPGILQAGTLEWVAIAFSNAWKWKVKGKSLSRILLFATLWSATYQAPPSMGFSRQEYWSGVHCLLRVKHPTELLFCGSCFSSRCPALKCISPVPKLFFPLLLLLYFSSLPISLHLWSRVTSNAYCLRSKRLQWYNIYKKTYVVTINN